MSQTFNAKKRHRKHKRDLGCLLCDPKCEKGKLVKEEKRRIKDDYYNS